MRLILSAALLTLAAPIPLHAESLSTCKELKEKGGTTMEYLKCVARQPVRNYLPGAGPGGGMLMDEMDTTVNKEICAGFCDGREPGDKVGDCTCK